MKLVLANIDYRGHTTDEGDQLQRGFAHAGWTLAGAGFGDGCRDVPTLLNRHRPEMVFVQDKRDWDPSNRGCFNKRVGFTNLGALAARPDIVKLAVVKDAGSMIDYHREFCEEIAADGVVTYYHDRSVLTVSPWLRKYPLVRTFHTVDRNVVESLTMRPVRKYAIVSGAVSPVYPLRQMVKKHAMVIGCDVLAHPGYSNAGSHTNEYLRTLAGYKVHVATSSSFFFALRKIIESVAVGCTPVTDLPAYDQLPGIDDALIRIPHASTVAQVKEAVEYAANTWRFDQRMEWAKVAQAMYDYRVMGVELDAKITALKVAA